MKIYRKGDFKPVVIVLENPNEVAELHGHLQRAKFYGELVKVISAKLFEIMEAEHEVPPKGDKQ